mmetsp:Transcript_53786/g.89477  ORF Transcript_53786/g.89477 Transcript_53786/m.89477 type:complete len:268 (+) Transcript_53786:393-1196(+)
MGTNTAGSCPQHEWLDCATNCKISRIAPTSCNGRICIVAGGIQWPLNHPMEFKIFVVAYVHVFTCAAAVRELTSITCTTFMRHPSARCLFHPKCSVAGAERAIPKSDGGPVKRRRPAGLRLQFVGLVFAGHRGLQIGDGEADVVRVGDDGARLGIPQLHRLALRIDTGRGVNAHGPLHRRGRRLVGHKSLGQCDLDLVPHGRRGQRDCDGDFGAHGAALVGVQTGPQLPELAGQNDAHSVRVHVPQQLRVVGGRPDKALEAEGLDGL